MNSSYEAPSWRGSMQNVQIVVTDNFTIVVIADTKRFGKQQIMFEGRTLMEACDYIRRTTGKNHFQLKGLDAMRKFKDPDGRLMPWIMDVVL